MQDTYAADYTMAVLAKQLRAAIRQVKDAHVDWDLMDMVARDVMRRRQTTWFMETRWLVELFGVSPEILRRFRAVYAYYESYDMPDHQLLERTFNILKRDSRDFYVIRAYCYMLLWHSQQLIVPLSLETRHAQLYGLRRRWDIPEAQDMPQDIGWAYFCPGSRRWFSAEASAPRFKVDTMRDRQRYKRDLGIDQGRAAQMVRLAKSQLAMRQFEKESELMFSINLEHAAYSNASGALFARRKTDPNLRRLHAIANLVHRPDTTPAAAAAAATATLQSGVAGRAILAQMNERELMAHMGVEIDMALAEMADTLEQEQHHHHHRPSAASSAGEEALTTAASATALQSSPGGGKKRARPPTLAPGSLHVRHVSREQDEEEEEEDLLLTLETVAPAGEEEDDDTTTLERPLKRARRDQHESSSAPPQRVLGTDDITIVALEDRVLMRGGAVQFNVRRQYGFLSDDARQSYRSSPVAIQSRYDSGFRSPLLPIDMVGRAVIMNEKLYCLCAVCGILTTYESGKMTGNVGPTCGLHDPNALYKNNRRFLMLHGHQLRQRPSDTIRRLFGDLETYRQRQAELQRQAAVAEEKDGAKQPMAAIDDEDVDEIDWRQARRHCIFCDLIGPMTGRASHRLVTRTMMREKDARLMRVKICRRDERFARRRLQSTTAGGYPSYERVLRAVMQGRYLRTAGVERGRPLPFYARRRGSAAGEPVHMLAPENLHRVRAVYSLSVLR